MSFGERLKQIRKFHNKSQREVAKAAGIDHTYLSKIENGALPPPSAKTLRKIFEFLGEESLALYREAGICYHCQGTGKAPRPPSI